MTEAGSEEWMPLRINASIDFNSVSDGTHDRRAYFYSGFFVWQQWFRHALLKPYLKQVFMWLIAVLKLFQNNILEGVQKQYH